jgi:hypothetical protein
MTFDAFFKQLKENDIWWDQLPLTYRNRDMPMVARQLFTWMLAQEKSFDDWKEIRGWYQKFLWQAGEVDQTPKYEKLVPVNVDNAIPKDDPRYMEYTNKLLEIIKNTPKWQRPVPVLDKEKEGAERIIPHSILYTSTTPEEAKAKERHLAYVKYCFDAVTGEPNSNYMGEDEYNKLFEEGLI